MEYKKIICIDVHEFNLSIHEVDEICNYFEIQNDLYYRFYPYDKHSGNYTPKEIKKIFIKISNLLIKNHVIEPTGNKYYYILLHFDW
jgi:hypothetical protein